MKKKHKYLLKNVGVLTIGNLSSKILIFLLVPLYTSVLSVEEYGVYDLAASMVQLLMPVATCGIIGGVMRFIMDQSSDRQEVIRIGIFYVVKSSLAVSFFLLVCHIFRFIPAIEGLEIYIAAYYMFYAANQLLIQIAKGFEKIKSMAASGILSTAGMVAFNLLFLLALKWGVKGFFMANILSQSISVFFLARQVGLWERVWIRKKSAGGRQLKKEMLQYSVPLILVDIGWWVNNSSDKYTVALLCGVGMSGIFSVSYKIPSILNVFQGIFMQAWQISAIRESAEKDGNVFYGNIFILMNFGMYAVCSVLLLFLRPIAGILFSGEFYGAWQYVPFLLVSSVLNASAGFMGAILSAEKDSGTMAISAFYGAGANFILNILFVLWGGVQGAAIATAIASFIIYAVRKRKVKGMVVFRYTRSIMCSWLLLSIQAFLKVYMDLWIIQVILILVTVSLYIKPIGYIRNRFVKERGQDAFF